MSNTAVETARRETEVLRARLRDVAELMKPRVMSLVVFTALAGLVAAPGEMDPVAAIVALVCIAVGAGASGALNMWYDADIDAVMTRTASRPVPRGTVLAQEALVIGLALSVAATLSLGILINWVAAALLALTIVYYIGIYTIWLKRSTPQNIVIGGAAGAFPPMIGWAAATGSIGIEPVVLFLIIFLWTPPHFWALALNRARDYEDAGVPMMPVARGAEVTRRLIMLYSLALVPVGVLPWLMGFGGLAYALAAIVLGARFLQLAWRVYRPVAEVPADRAQGRLFAFSIVYLFALFAALLAEHLFGVIMVATA